jgi:hypothetical protein
MRRIDHRGRRYGQLIVTSRTRRGTDGSYYVRAQCRCGVSKRFLLCHLVSHHTQSCGHCDWASTRHQIAGSQGPLTHGHTRGRRRSPEYIAWMNLHQRCENSNRPDFAYWGGRGIRVAKRWCGPKGFVNFLADMKVRGQGLSIHRKDSNKNYTPSNCVWADSKTQNNEKAA